MTLSQRVRHLSPSLTLALTAKAKALRAQGKSIVLLTAGEPDFDTFPAIKQAAVDALAGGFTKYTPTTGIPELKERIREKLERENGVRVPAEGIVLSCGAKHSLYNIFQAILEPGDEVLLPSPYWLSYPEMIKLAGGLPRALPGREQDRFKVSLDDLKKAVTSKTRALVYNSPANPTGTVYGRPEVERIAKFAVEHDLILVSDEIYERYVFDGLEAVSPASVSEAAARLTLTVNGFSKTFSMTGWRLGYLATQDVELARAIGNLQDHMTSNPTSFVQRAALTALDPARTPEIRSACDLFEKRRNLIVRLLRAVPRLAVTEPQGAFYVFVRVDAFGLDSLTFSERLLAEEGVAVVPGKPFGSDAHVRLSFATSEQEIEEGVKRMGAWLGRL